MSEPRLSIVVCNFNYEAFVGAAIRSALAVDWPDREVIVVDDGSTDESRRVIDEFGDQIKALYIDNQGQKDACVTGFRISTGDIVIFLDSDDILESQIMREAWNVWTSDTTKVQVQMQPINEQGAAFSNPFPVFRRCPSADDIKLWTFTAASHPTPPGSGNLYSRAFVQKVFDFPTDFVDRAPDSYLISAAPILGKVHTVPKPLACYRIHGRNHGAFSSLDRSRFAREVVTTSNRFKFAHSVAVSEGIEHADEILERNTRFLSLCAASYVLARHQHPVHGHSRLRLSCRALQSLHYPQGFGFNSHAILVGWIIAVLTLPRSIAGRLIEWRYIQNSRPSFLRRWLGAR